MPENYEKIFKFSKLLHKKPQNSLCLAVPEHMTHPVCCRVPMFNLIFTQLQISCLCSKLVIFTFLSDKSVCFYFYFQIFLYSMNIDSKWVRKWLRVYEKMRRRLSKKKILGLTSICLVALLIYCLYEWKILCSHKRLQTTIGKKDTVMDINLHMPTK